MASVSTNFVPEPQEVCVKTMRMGQYGQITEWSGSRNSNDNLIGQLVHCTYNGVWCLDDGDGWSSESLNATDFNDCKVRICKKGERITITV